MFNIIKYVLFIDQLIDMNVLVCMKPEHVSKLLHKFPLGIIILFEHKLTEWQNGINVGTVNNSKTNVSSEIHPKACKEQNLNTHIKARIELKLDEILNQSEQGSLILNYYEKHNKLNDGIRTTLVDLLIGYILTKKIQMSVGLAESMANEIVAMFKTETKV